THDRYLLETVSTHILALDGQGNAQFFADYTQWESARATAASAPSKPASAKPSAAPAPAKEAKGAKKLSYKDKLEWDAMEEKITEAEGALATAQAAVEDPAVASNPTELQARCEMLEAARREVERLYARWAELEEKQK
ncbi:MAG TPA: ABC transporter ATP-binding protein, partial [Thermoanaerobaculia bacterium]|nr:ABC transporter ATP-binding protein [Thermoanaerobaculia bacterium]